MATDIKLYTPLKTIVAHFLSQYSKSMNEFDKCWLLALRGLTDMHFDISAEPKTVRIPVDGNKTVPFPDDCVGISKVGIMNDKGEILCLKINNALTTFRDNNPQRITDLTSDVDDSIGFLQSTPLFFNYYYDSNYYTLYGVGGGLITYGSCRIDTKNEVIILDEDFKYDSILVEYISSPEKDADYQVLTVLQEAIIAFIEWKLKLGTEQNYYARVISGRRRLNNKKVSLQEVNDVLRESAAMKLRS